MSSEISNDASRPRLCHLRKWPDFNGYGFNLHAERGKAGQFVGSVDEHSPAQSAGLRVGDRIVEVNGVNIGSENHQQVVQRVKSVANETKLLVVDHDGDAYYRDRHIVIMGDMSNVEFLESPATNPYTNVAEKSENGNDYEEEEDRPRFPSVSASLASDDGGPSPFSSSNSVHRETEPRGRTGALSDQPVSGVQIRGPVSSVSSSEGRDIDSNLEFAGSAKEARERMAKKRTTKVESTGGMSLKDKYDLLQKL